MVDTDGPVLTPQVLHSLLVYLDQLRQLLIQRFVLRQPLLELVRPNHDFTCTLVPDLVWLGLQLCKLILKLKLHLIQLNFDVLNALSKQVLIESDFADLVNYAVSNLSHELKGGKTVLQELRLRSHCAVDHGVTRVRE